MKLKKLTEELSDGFNIKDDYQEVYKNPSPDEINKVAGTISGDPGFRYFATPKRQIFVFSPKITHFQAIKRMAAKRRQWLDVDYLVAPDIIAGIARKSGSGWVTIASHNITYAKTVLAKKNVRELLDRNWKWLDKYVLTTPFLNNLRRRRGILKKIEEEFLTSGKQPNNMGKEKYFEIFKNPSRKEIAEVAKRTSFNPKKNFRFFATRKKDLYVFEPELLHAQATSFLRKEKVFPWEDGFAIGGLAQLKKEKWIIVFIDNIQKYSEKAVANWKNKDEWKWLNKYNIFFPSKA